MKPAYLHLHQTGELEKRAQKARNLLDSCTLCPRQCKVNRNQDEIGICGIGREARVASYGPHFGEEQPLVGTHGSGTIFFCGCNLHCVFCQNEDISRADGEGVSVDASQLAAVMLELQAGGCHNINLVTPSHVVPQILEALLTAVPMGLHLPLVYNTGGYDDENTLALLDGVVDIYMPDFKFWEPETSKRYARAPDYPERARRAITVMHTQVGELQIDDHGLAVRGLLVRHLLMPDMLDQSKEIFSFLATSISKDTYINIMDQYRPCGKASRFKELDRTIMATEHSQALALAREAGLHRIDRRDFEGLLEKLRRMAEE